MASKHLPARNLSRWFPLTLSALALIALTVVFVLALSRYLSSEEVSLPDVVGMDAAEAMAVLAELNIEARTYNEDVPGTAVNAVTSQSPEAGVLVRRGRTVAVGVHSPSSQIEVPSLVGVTRTQAVQILGELELYLGEVSYESGDAPDGDIIAQSPTAGAVLSTDDRVDITVSRGAPLATYKMPQVEGLSVTDASRRLRESGLQNIDSRATSVSSTRSNRVVNQLPPAGQEVSASTRIVLGYALPSRTVVQVPSLMGTSLSRVQTSLRRAGLSLGNILYIDDPEQPPGIVSFAPSGYTLRGSPVEVTINRLGLNESISDIRTPASGGSDLDFPPTAGIGPSIPDEDAQGSISVRPSNSRPVSTDTVDTASPDIASPRVSVAQADGGRLIDFRFDPATSGIPSLAGKPVRLRLEVEDERGERILFDQNVPAGQNVDLPVTVYGDATLREYINDILFRSWNPL